MKDFDHPNVLTILGICIDSGATPYVVMPFMSHGSLKSYLKDSGSKLMVSADETDEDTVSWLPQFTSVLLANLASSKVIL